MKKMKKTKKDKKTKDKNRGKPTVEYSYCYWLPVVSPRPWLKLPNDMLEFPLPWWYLEHLLESDKSLALLVQDHAGAPFHGQDHVHKGLETRREIKKKWKRSNFVVDWCSFLEISCVFQLFNLFSLKCDGLASSTDRPFHKFLASKSED